MGRFLIENKIEAALLLPLLSSPLLLSLFSSHYRNYTMWIMCYLGRNTKEVYWSDKKRIREVL